MPKINNKDGVNEVASSFIFHVLSKLINPTASGGNLFANPTVSPNGSNVVSPVAVA